MCVIEHDKWRERERERETETQRNRQRDRQRETERERGRMREREREVLRVNNFILKFYITIVQPVRYNLNIQRRLLCFTPFRPHAGILLSVAISVTMRLS
jgi:hypothetical protein